MLWEVIRKIFKPIDTYIITMVTTIQISNELLDQLKKMKLSAGESYENIIWDLVEDRMELSEETKKAIKEYEKSVKEGTAVFYKLDDMKKEWGLNV